MRSMELVFFVTLCCILLQATAHNEAIEAGRIFGGHEAKGHSYPFMVSLQIRFLWVRSHLCGGSLISRNWVLTAGHCINMWPLRFLGLDAIAGLHDVITPESQAQIIPVVERIPHPKYGGDIGPNDIGLVRTQYSFHFTKYIQPIRLPTDFTLYPTLVLVGWGELKTGWLFPNMPTKLQEVEQEYIPHKKCYATIERLKDAVDINLLTEQAHICAGARTARPVAACNGDSGGPLIQYVPMLKPFNETTVENMLEEEISDEEESYENIPVLIGVVSWGLMPCGMKDAPTVFTNVSDYIDFVLKTTKIKLI